jgi:hypothetical protein
MAAGMREATMVHSDNGQRRASLATNPSLEIPNRTGLLDYVSILPDLRRRAYRRMTESKSVSTIEIVGAFTDLGMVLQQALVVLLGHYPENHFSDSGSKHYVAAIIAQSTHWHYMRASAFGVGQSGSVVQTLTAEGTVRDLERWIGEIVFSLCGMDVRLPNEDERAWQHAWSERLPQ